MLIDAVDVILKEIQELQFKIDNKKSSLFSWKKQESPLTISWMEGTHVAFMSSKDSVEIRDKVIAELETELDYLYNDKVEKLLELKDVLDNYEKTL